MSTLQTVLGEKYAFKLFSKLSRVDAKVLHIANHILQIIFDCYIFSIKSCE